MGTTGLHMLFWDVFCELFWDVFMSSFFAAAWSPGAITAMSLCWVCMSSLQVCLLRKLQNVISMVPEKSYLQSLIAFRIYGKFKRGSRYYIFLRVLKMPCNQSFIFHGVYPNMNYWCIVDMQQIVNKART